MKTEELQERLDDIEPILASQSKRLAELENKEVTLPEIKFPDYSLLFEEVKSEIRTAAKMQQHNLISSAEELKQQITEFKTIAEQIPKVVIPVKHYHQISVKAKMFIAGGILVLVITALTVALTLQLYQENRLLRKSDVKFKLLRQYYPTAAKWADDAFEQGLKLNEKFIEKNKTGDGVIAPTNRDQNRQKLIHRSRKIRHQKY